MIESVKLLDGPIAENAAWDVADLLKELLIEVAPPEYIYWALVDEKGRTSDRTHGWSKYFRGDDLKEFIRSFEEDLEQFDTSKPAERLAALYRIRDGEGRHGRARDAMGWSYLLWVSLLLFASAIALLLVLSWHLLLSWYLPPNLIEQSLIQMPVVFASGAVGAVLSGAIRLPDLGDIVELQAAWMTLIPQMILGATLAAVVFLILQIGVIKIGGLNFETAKPAELFVVGFVSGFSEPFAFGILDKVTALGK